MEKTIRIPQETKEINEDTQAIEIVQTVEQTRTVSITSLKNELQSVTDQITKLQERAAEIQSDIDEVYKILKPE